MAECRRVYLQGGEIFEARCADGGGSPAEQLERAIADCHAALESQGLSPRDVVLTRLWMSDRDSGATLNEVRDRMRRAQFRSASSSFFSRGRMPDGANVYLEFYALRMEVNADRRIVDFDPPRRYAHYIAAGDWLFLSGMAEEADTTDAQFERAFAQVEAALEAERFAWEDVLSASLFLQRGKATPDWMLKRFRDAAPVEPPVLTFEEVDELANTPKHLEIEIVARRPRG